MPGFLFNLSDFPVELLQIIFTCCTELTDKHYAAPPWIAITRVCRHWRAIALDHHSLWTSITSQLHFCWARAFMERLKPALVDVTIFSYALSSGSTPLSILDIVTLLSDCTRLRSLHIAGRPSHILQILAILPPQASIHTFCLIHRVLRPSAPLELPVSLFGGHAPIREISFDSNTHILAPHWLFHGITRFECHQQIPLHALLDVMRGMPMLQHFELHSPFDHQPWKDTDAPQSIPIQMPNLMCFSVHAHSLRFFMVLNQRLALPEGVKRRLELLYQMASDLDHWETWIPPLLACVRATDSLTLTNIQLSGGALDGWIRIWAGDVSVTSYEDAGFSFSMNWSVYLCPKQLRGIFQTPIVHIASLCDLLGAASTRRLIFDARPDDYDDYRDQSRSALWAFLGKLNAVEELELCTDSAEVLRDAWRKDNAPAVLPALRRVRMVKADNTAPCVSAITEEGLLRLLHGNGRRHKGANLA